MKRNCWKKGYWLLLFVLGISLCGCSAQQALREGSSGTKQNTVSEEKSGQNVASDEKDEQDAEPDEKSEQKAKSDTVSNDSVSLANIPDFSGKPYVILENNIPDFSEKDYTTNSFEKYSKLDSLGRCQRAYANIGQDIMPQEERQGIGMIRPSGWHTVKYGCVDGKYLYNRCHLIGFQLAGENANKKNLITGTRYMNVEGMLPFENEVAEYVQETNHHVLYRVTPVYDGDDLVAKGVRMEAYSVEDKGKGVCFHVFVYNSQPGVEIDYATGKSRLSEEVANESNIKSSGENDAKKSVSDSNAKQSEDSVNSHKVQTYILNKNTHKFHLPSCSSVGDMKGKNKKSFEGTKEELESMGYEACKRCLKE